MQFKLGKKKARAGSIKLRFSAYAKNLPKVPVEFGHETLVMPWHLLGNDRWSNCFWAGAAHEQYLWSAEGTQRVHMTTIDTLDDYGACTGFSPGDLMSDQGTDLQQGAKYRQQIGVRDARNVRHKIGAYAALQPGNLQEHQEAAYLLSAVGMGLLIGDNQQEQFTSGLPWDGPTGPNAGGHYVPFVCMRNKLLWIVTWGKLQAVTPQFFASQNDESVAYFSSEMLRDGNSPEGFDAQALQSDLALLMA